MKRCRACRNFFDHRMLPKCPHCGKSTTTIQALLAESRRLRAQVTKLQEHNNAELERRRKAEADLEAILLLGGRGPLGLILEELAKARAKYPNFAINEEEALAVLGSEFGELASAVLRRDVHGEHGIIREAAQVAAVAIRIVEMGQEMEGGE